MTKDLLRKQALAAEPSCRKIRAANTESCSKAEAYYHFGGLTCKGKDIPVHQAYVLFELVCDIHNPCPANHAPQDLIDSEIVSAMSY